MGSAADGVAIAPVGLGTNTTVCPGSPKEPVEITEVNVTDPPYVLVKMLARAADGDAAAPVWLGTKTTVCSGCPRGPLGITEVNVTDPP